MSKKIQPKPIQPISSTLFCGIDVSAKTLAVALHQQDRAFQQRDFANTKAGHQQLIAWLSNRGGAVRVSLEATGIYSLDVALALDACPGIEVAVLNPKLVNRFAQTLRRSKTDKADAQVLAEYSLRMPFERWQRPDRVALELRAMGRHIDSLTREHTRLKNRLHAATGSASTPRCVVQDMKRSMEGLQKRIVKLRREAVAMVEKDSELKRKLARMLGIPGIGETSGVQLLSELASLDPLMGAREWVAMSGLDPSHRESGTSVRGTSRMSRQGNRHLRGALYMPAMVGVRFDPHLRAFYEALQSRHKTKMQALMAVARKLLHAIFGMFKTDTAWDGAKLFPQMKLA